MVGAIPNGIQRGSKSLYNNPKQTNMNLKETRKQIQTTCDALIYNITKRLKIHGPRTWNNDGDYGPLIVYEDDDNIVDILEGTKIYLDEGKWPRIGGRLIRRKEYTETYLDSLSVEDLLSIAEHM